MSTISRACPGWVQQSLENSCWAAVLEAWSRVDPRLPTLRQDTLISRWGEDETGSISPDPKIRLIADAYHLRWEVRTSGRLQRCLRNHLAGSHLFVAYTIGAWTHTVLLYRLRDTDVAYMDPNGGRYLVRELSWLEPKGPFVVMWKH